MTDQPQASGVQELIDRLQQEGVEEGKSQAEQLLAGARKEAARILDDARKQTEQLLEDARAEAEHTKEKGEAALRLASRDAVLALDTQVHNRVRERLQKLIDHTLSDRQFLERLILEVAGRTMPKDYDGPVQILLPDTELTMEQLRAAPESTTEETLTKFVMDMMGDSLRDGITFDTSGVGEPGIRIRLLEDDVQIDVTGDAISGLLMRHLLPRFRAIMNAD